jgi:hypothetical protein
VALAAIKTSKLKHGEHKEEEELPDEPEDIE